MTIRIFLLALVSGLFFSACEKNHTHESGVPFTISYKATYDGEQLTKYKNYPYGTAAYPLQFSRFSTYLSDIELIKADGSTHRLTEIEWVEFTPDNASTDLSAIPAITYNNVPEGEYTGIRIGYGVKPSLNAKVPADFSGNHPLARELEYWSGWDSYIFNKIEGQGDADNNGAFDHFLLFHCGSDAVYKVYEFSLPIHVHAGHPGLNVTFDLKKLFILADGSWYDIVTNHATSNNPNDISVALVLMNNFEKATSVTQE
ncbi:MAG: MbnP family protein [Saprospiraceae bacterium]|nr:MbnP family protein [Saprospiraceae bacterium]